MAERTCRFISNRGPTGSPQFSVAENVYEKFIQPVVTSNFEDFVVYLFEYEDQPGSFGDDFLEKIVDVDLVIADLTELTATAFFQLGVRYYSGKPLVFIADEEYTLALHPTDFPFVKYRYENGFSEDQHAAVDLVDAIHAALDPDTARGTYLPQKRLSPRQTRAQLAARISEAADAIRLLRINSAAETAIELEDIAKELEQIPEDKLVPALQETADKFLKVLSRFADQLGTIRGSRMLISGLISVVIGGAGYSGIAAFGMSLAFWEGKEAFLKAIEIFGKRKK
jgi:hypothetical protein